MYRYRMTIKANVCFDVVADTEEEALAKAREVALEHTDGLAVVEGDNRGMRVYIGEECEPTVENQSDEQSLA